MDAALVIDTSDIGAEQTVILAHNADSCATLRSTSVVVALVLQVAEDVREVVNTALDGITIVDGAIDAIVTSRIPKRRNLAKSSRVVAN